jgi:hypothetical protein
MVTPKPNSSTSHGAKDLIGTWSLVSVVTERDGKKSDAYGPNAKGSLVFDANGRYSIIFIAADLPNSFRVIEPPVRQMRTRQS